MTAQSKLSESPLLDVVHANSGPRRRSAHHLCVAPKVAIRHDGWQSIHVDDMVNLWMPRRGHAHNLLTFAMRFCSRAGRNEQQRAERNCAPRFLAPADY